MIRSPKNSHLWLPALLKQRIALRKPPADPTHVYVCLADHFEPGWGRAPLEIQRQRVDTWMRRYPEIAARHRDSQGRPPQHTFFFPAEEYVPEHLDRLAKLCQGGWGDVEVHLHHDGDTAAHLRDTLLTFTNTLYSRHGLLRKGPRGEIAYGFIHGNWALNNSRPDGRWCGVDDETTVLLETGCYADFTMPSVPSATQSRVVNSINYAMPQDQPRAQDRGLPARAGQVPPNGLLLIQGPLSLDWRHRKWHILPRIENGEVDAHHLAPSPERVALWIHCRIHLPGAAGHIFVKLFTHGAHERNTRALLGDHLGRLWHCLEQFCGPESSYRLHYVTASEMFQVVRRLETTPSQQVPTPADVSSTEP